jgi:DNA-binding winged helix-turn-helix (wHTH) protein
MDLIRVGNFDLFPSERLLCSAGKQLELGSRAFDVLLVLVEYHGRLVTKATLLDRVWPRLVVDENNIPTQISSLRRILGVGAIRTVQGYGYRLDLDVSRPESERAPTIPNSPTQPPRRTPQRRAWPNRIGPLVGRDDDIRNVKDALRRSNVVTIVGIAGVGKTRLAQEILVSEPENAEAAVAWVSLATLDHIDRVPSAIAIALGISLADGIEEFTALRQAIANMPLLLILDCAEHLSDALVAPLADLILQTQAVRVLAA